MAIIANTFTSFDAKGIREDLSNVIKQLILSLVTVIENPVNCWKLLKGQSAAKPGRNVWNVQRLEYGAQNGR